MLSTIKTGNKKGLPSTEAINTAIPTDPVLASLFSSIHNTGNGLGTDIKPNTDLNNVTALYTNPNTAKDIINQNQKMLIKHNGANSSFDVHSQDGSRLGSFSVYHIAKYLSEGYDTKKQFLRQINADEYAKGKELIKSLIFTLRYNKKTNYCDILLNNYTKSGFMGDLDLLVLLNNDLDKYCSDGLGKDLLDVDIDNRGKIEQNIRTFIFMMLSYTLQIISQASGTVTDEVLKKKMLEYSISLIYKLDIFVQCQLKIINAQNNVIKDTMATNMEMRRTMDAKLEMLMGYMRLNPTLQNPTPPLPAAIPVPPPSTMPFSGPPSVPSTMPFSPPPSAPSTMPFSSPQTNAQPTADSQLFDMM